VKRFFPFHREFLWLAPFLCIAFFAAGLLRPLPRIPLPADYRTVVDAGGTPVHIALPFRGIALTKNSFANSYLENTRSPGLLVYADKPSGAMSWVYPELLKRDSLWNTQLIAKSDSPYTEVERLLAYDPSVYVGCGGPRELVLRIGLPVYNCGGSDDLRRRRGLPDLAAKAGCGTPPDPMQSRYPRKWNYYSESYLFPGVRTYSALIGSPEAAETRVDAYCQAVADLREELRPSTLTSRPHVLAEGESAGLLPRAGIIDAAMERKIAGDDAEHLLIMNPDMIFLPQGNPRDFMRDPRWQGLKAVLDRRVYRRPGLMEWWAGGLTFKPIETRWMAEIAHPERLQPKVRQILRDRMISEFGYRFTEDQIDRQLHVAENAASVGTERFSRDSQIDRKPGASAK
jgi:ABC-type Fe3+-hydroxamate transport system substrate-binding protein